MEITKIVVTGGPCGGKSTALDCIRTEFTKQGYTVLTVAETATEMISGGVTPWGCNSPVAYQYAHIPLQLAKELAYRRGAERMPAEKVLIVCDRALYDSRAYIPDEDFYTILAHYDLDPEAILKSYDAVFHLVTAAKGAEAFYTTANNTARTETVAEAAALDDSSMRAWSGHPHHYIIDNSTDFAGKMDRLIRAIGAFLDSKKGA